MHYQKGEPKMLKMSCSLLAVVFMAACSTVPTLKEVQASKPSVFKAQVAATPESCGKPPTAPVDLALDGFYSDSGKGGAYSKIDMKLFNAWKDAVKPLDDWNYAINKFADEYAIDKKVESGKCAIAFIDEWARGDALLGEMKKLPNNPRQSFYHQKWLFGTAAAAYFKVQDLATPDQDTRIKWWLTQVSKPVKSFWENGIGNGMEYRQNHYAAAAVGVMQVGILTNSKEDIEWGRSAFKHFMREVRSDGYLTTEIIRGRRSRFYHNYILQPLGYMAQLSKLIGEDWWQDEKMQRLIDKTLASTLDFSLIASAANAEQDSYRPDEWGWYALLPDNDPRRVKMTEFMLKTAVVSYSTDKKYTMKKFPAVKELGGDQQAFRDLVEKKLAKR
jgi:hypothetical protein